MSAVTRHPTVHSVGRANAPVEESNSPQPARSWDQRWWTALSWGLLTAAVAIFLYRTYRYGGYFAEDAYISFRYATNLANGYGLVWNIGGEPVEGYTSPLHIFLLAAGLLAGLSVQSTSILIGYLSVAGIVGVYLLLLRKELGRLTFVGAAVVAVYLIDARLAIHTVAGLDTVMYMVLLAVAYAASLRFVESPGFPAAVLLAAADVLCLLGRPDAVPYVAGQAIVIGLFSVYTYLTRRDRRLLAFSALSYIVLCSFGAAYLAWKYSYFGYLLPNPFYIKSSEYTSLYGMESVIAFARSLVERYSLVIVPAFFLIRYSSVIAWWKYPINKAKAALLLVPPTLFLLYYTTVIPEVNYASRFQYPTYFFFGLAIAIFISKNTRAPSFYARLASSSSALWSKVVPFVSIAAAIFLLAFTYRITNAYFPWFQLMEENYYRPIAKALMSTGLGPRGVLVLDTAGFIPFTSQFSHIDPVGLNDNTLSGRHPISAWERERYIWGRNPDVYIGPEPPASPLAANCSTDPAASSAYAKEVLLDRIGNPYLRAYGRLSYDERCDALHVRMRELRDRWLFLGAITYPAPITSRYMSFAYVRKESAHFDQLVAALSPLISKQPMNIDLDAPPADGAK